MRPRLFTPRKLILFLLAATIFVGLSTWIARGMPLPGAGVPSTAGKLAFISDRAGNPDVWMMNGDGSDPVAITSGAVSEAQPSWSSSGSELAFVGAKSATDSPQVYMADAMPGRNAVLLTRTSGAKSAPRFGEDRELYFLDAGKVNSYDLAGQDSHAVFPESDHKRALADFLSEGGVESAHEIGEHRYALVVNTEQGQLLLLYQFNHDSPDSLLLALLGTAKKIEASRLQTGGFVAAFEDGAPLREPLLLLNAQAAAGGSNLPAPTEFHSASGVQAFREDAHALALFDENGAAQSMLPLPAPVNEVVAAADGKSIVLAPTPGSKNVDMTGLILVTPAEEKIQQIATGLSATQPSISPDGTQVAFVSGKDIYVVGTEPNAEPRNVTQGKGKNSAPVWSPTVRTKK